MIGKIDIPAFGSEETHAIIERFFGTRFFIFGVADEDGEVFAFAAIIGNPEPEDSPIERAAAAWNEQFGSRTFEDVAGIIMTFMDCLLEQQETNP